MNVLVAILVLATLLEFVVVHGFVCSNFNSHMGATFDLHELQVSSSILRGYSSRWLEHDWTLSASL